MCVKKRLCEKSESRHADCFLGKNGSGVFVGLLSAPAAVKLLHRLSMCASRSWRLIMARWHLGVSAHAAEGDQAGMLGAAGRRTGKGAGAERGRCRFAIIKARKRDKNAPKGQTGATPALDAYSNCPGAEGRFFTPKNGGEKGGACKGEMPYFLHDALFCAFSNRKTSLSVSYVAIEYICFSKTTQQCLSPRVSGSCFCPSL